MTLDYDHVVIGNTPEAVYSVLEGAKLCFLGYGKQVL